MHHAVLPGMVERKRGRIVNMASDAARVGSSGEAVYAACKGGLVAFSKTMAREHARHGITVNVVCPGPTDTALLAGVPKARATRRSCARPSSAPSRWAAWASRGPARRHRLLRQRRRGFITGQVLSVSGGLTMNG
jgi:2-hydroxycyclohexanecarboxyl-CoA dehydrogenase